MKKYFQILEVKLSKHIKVAIKAIVQQKRIHNHSEDFIDQLD